VHPRTGPDHTHGSVRRATYLSQQVGPDTLRDLSERFEGPRTTETPQKREPERHRRLATDAGLEVIDLRAERPKTTFNDIGAVVYFLRLVVWIVPGFDVETHRPQLRALHERMPYETTASRFLIEAVKPNRR
jgi:hypothetical protein